MRSDATFVIERHNIKEHIITISDGITIIFNHQWKCAMNFTSHDKVVVMVASVASGWSFSCDKNDNAGDIYDDVDENNAYDDNDDCDDYDADENSADSDDGDDDEPNADGDDDDNVCSPDWVSPRRPPMTQGFTRALAPRWWRWWWCWWWWWSWWSWWSSSSSEFCNIIFSRACRQASEWLSVQYPVPLWVSFMIMVIMSMTMTIHDDYDYCKNGDFSNSDGDYWWHFLALAGGLRASTNITILSTRVRNLFFNIIFCV